MRGLIDTHTLLWWLADDSRLSQTAADAIDNPEAEVLVSAASVWEICTKHRIGKLPTAAHLVESLPLILKRLRFTSLPITLEHAQLAGRLRAQHKDPFDRMLAAQASLQAVPLITNDPAFAALGVAVIW